MLGINSGVRRFRTIKLEGGLKRVDVLDGSQRWVFPQLDPRSRDPRQHLEYYPFLSTDPLSDLTITIETEGHDTKLEYNVPVLQTHPVVRRTLLGSQTLHVNYVNILEAGSNRATEILLGVDGYEQPYKVRIGLYKDATRNQRAFIIPVRA